eukprot:gene6554-6303_t
MLATVLMEHPAGSDPVRFLVIGDWGCGPAFADTRRVAAAMGQFAEAHPVDFVISTGDNFYGPARPWLTGGVASVDDPQFAEKFTGVFAHPSLQVPFYLVFGNHDLGFPGNASAQLLYRGDPRWNMPDILYTMTFPVGGTGKVLTIVFVCTEFLKWSVSPKSYAPDPAP